MRLGTSNTVPKDVSHLRKQSLHLQRLTRFIVLLISAWRINPTLSAECPMTFPEGDVREV